MAYPNGLIPLTAMRQLSTGGYLLANAAAAFETWRIQARAAGFDMRPTSNSDAFRPLAVQEAIFFARYSRTDYGRRTPGAIKTYRGVTYYLKPGVAVAATPGSSNHGKGLAVDIRNSGGFGGAYHNWMSRTGPALGFTNAEGRSINEPWHWVHSGAFTVSNPIGGGGSVAIPTVPGRPAPLEEEDDMTPDQVRLLTEIHSWLAVPGQPYGYPAATHNLLAAVGKDVSNAAADVRTVRAAQTVPGQPFDWAPATHNAIAALIGEVAGMRAALGAVATGTGLTPEQITKAAQAGAEQALKGITITVDTKD